jgi:hypothetical protein
LPEDSPEPLRSIVYKCMEKRLEDRFQSAAEMREALQKIDV